MIKLYFSNGKAFVWNAEDAYTLRKEYRVVGSLVGSYPIKPFQIQTKWLPLQLMPEETKLLIDKGIAELVSVPDKTINPAIIESFLKQRDKLCEEQISLLIENRKKQILEKADKIYEGKKRKYIEALEKNKAQKTSKISIVTTKKDLPETSASCSQENILSEKDNSNSSLECEENIGKTSVNDDSEKGSENPQSDAIDVETVNIDKNAIIEAELAKITGVNKELCLVQLFTECLWKKETEPVDWDFPSTEKEKLRYAVFKDLWEKKYYITSATKFGGDFLAYEGDPLKYHALFIVVCMDPGQKFQGYDIIVYGRLGHQVKKTVALASVNDDNEVEYISLSWENEMT